MSTGITSYNRSRVVSMMTTSVRCISRPALTSSTQLIAGCSSTSHRSPSPGCTPTSPPLSPCPWPNWHSTCASCNVPSCWQRYSPDRKSTPPEKCYRDPSCAVRPGTAAPGPGSDSPSAPTAECASWAWPPPRCRSRRNPLLDRTSRTCPSGT